MHSTETAADYLQEVIKKSANNNRVAICNEKTAQIAVTMRPRHWVKGGVDPRQVASPFQIIDTINGKYIIT